MTHHQGIKVDGQPVLGVPWMAVNHDKKDDEVHQSLTPDVDIMTRLNYLEKANSDLLSRVIELEARTWWSMLKGSIKSLFKTLKWPLRS